MNDEAVNEEIRKQKQIRDDFKKVFLGNKPGRRVLRDLLTEAGVFESSYKGDGATEYREGRRDIGLRILELLDKRTYAGLAELEKLGAVDTDIFD